MKIASAQLEVTVGDIAENFSKHLDIIDLAIANRVDLIVFPEMSLTGYCREEGHELVIAPTDSRIQELKKIAETHRIIIVVGAPIEINQSLFIGAYILMPNGKTEIYTKQFLHEGEDEFYSSSFDYNPQIEWQDEVIQLAICADIVEEQHAINAKENDCTIYIASIFYSVGGIEVGHELLSKYARGYSMQVLMSNFSGQVWGVKAGGRSGFWDETGNLISELETKEEGLLLVEKVGQKWMAREVKAKQSIDLTGASASYSD